MKTNRLQLTDDEKRMLDGDQGPLRQKALEFIVRYATALDAPKLVDITKAHLFAGDHLYLRCVGFNTVDEAIAKMHFCSDEVHPLPQVACYAQTDAGAMDPKLWRELGFEHKVGLDNETYLKRYLDAGVHLVGTCTPYMTGFIPIFGEHYVSTESHAIVLMNSLWGARANSDGIEGAFCSAFCGKTAYYGNHITEERKGNVLVEVDCDLKTRTDWELFGYTLGKQLPSRSIPVVKCKDVPDANKLRACFSALATTGGVELCHIVGVTPEAPDVKTAFGHKQVEAEIQINAQTLEDGRQTLSAQEGDVRFVALGCPHYSIDQIELVARFLKDKKVHPEVVLQIWTSSTIREIAEKSGYLPIIENAGGRVFEGSCAVLTDLWPRNEGMAFDSAKQANYLRPRTKAPVFYGTSTECLKAAVTGQWERGYE